MDRVRLRVGCEFRFAADVPAPAVMLVRARDDLAVGVRRETWGSEPAGEMADYRDLYGNPCRRMVLAAGKSVIRYDAEVDAPAAPDEFSPGAIQHAVEDLPPETLLYTLASRYCLSDMLGDMALELFGATTPGWWRVQAICDWVNANISFAYGSTNPGTTALDVLNTRTGVCRDFAHVAISLCRTFNIPSRYAFGYLPTIDAPPLNDPMDFAAWMEVYLGGRWWTFDPRNNTRRIGRVVIGRGRDATDVAMLTSYGAVLLEDMTVWADRVDDAAQ